MYREFCLDHRERLHELCEHHRYQMNEVGRCSGLIAALAGVADDRPLALVDVGTGAGLALHLDRYRYTYTRGGDGGGLSWGDSHASAVIETELRGAVDPALPVRVPAVAERVGIDVEPLDVRDPSVRSWLAACIPQEIGAVTRFHRAVELMLAEPVRTARGDAAEVLPAVVAGIEPGALVCVLDTYVAVFFDPPELQAFRAVIDAAGAERDLEWISIDPLVPMGTSATHCVTGAEVPPELIERNRDQGVFGVVSRVAYRRGVCTRAVLGFAHPGAAWLQWM